MEYTIEHKERLKFLCVTKTFNESDRTDDMINDFWSQVDGDGHMDALLVSRPIGKRNLCGVCKNTDNPDEFIYAVGVLVDEESDQDILKTVMENDVYKMLEFEPSDYAVFECRGYNGNCMEEVWAFVHGEFKQTSGYEYTGDYDYEEYMDDIDMDDIDMEDDEDYDMDDMEEEDMEDEDEIFCFLYVPVKRIDAE